MASLPDLREALSLGGFNFDNARRNAVLSNRGDKNCEKIHYIADNIWCCGAGTSADTENTTMLISSQLELHRMATGKQPRVVTACTMLKRMLFRYQGHVSAAR